MGRGLKQNQIWVISTAFLSSWDREERRLLSFVLHLSKQSKVILIQTIYHNCFIASSLAYGSISYIYIYQNSLLFSTLFYQQMIL